MTIDEGVLTFALICLYLWIPAGVLGELVSGGANDSGAVVPYVPFAISCVLAFFGILVFWSHAELIAPSRRSLSTDEKRRWRWTLLLGWIVTAPFYWMRFR